MARNAFALRTAVFVQQHLSAEARSAALARAARKGLADLIAAGRAIETYDLLVDGQLGRTEDQVRPDGVIVYRFQRIGEAAKAAVDFLKRRSPILTGNYQDSFHIAVNGRSIRAEAFDPKMAPADGELLIFNRQPYSRLVDSQRAGNRVVKFRSEPHLFDDAARAMKRRFRELDIQSLYTVTFPGQYRLVNSGKRVVSPGLVIRRNKDR